MEKMKRGQGSQASHPADSLALILPLLKWVQCCIGQEMGLTPIDRSNASVPCLPLHNHQSHMQITRTLTSETPHASTITLSSRVMNGKGLSQVPPAVFC